MAEELIIEGTSKTEKYEALIPQLKALCEGESNKIANMANFVAAIKQTFDYFWVGFYWVEDDELVLGPFQGPIACTRIKKGRGVCGKAWENEETLLVPNVNEFEGHIACNSLSKSEIVVPIKKNGKTIGVLDVDHNEFATFNEEDKKYLIEICTWFAGLL